MLLTPAQTFAMILAIACGSMLTRFTPFLLFPQAREQPKAVIYLGRALPSAMMGLLVVYCLKGISFSHEPYGLPELIAVLVTAVLHKWKGNALLSICLGTAVYMVLLQKIF